VVLFPFIENPFGVKIEPEPLFGVLASVQLQIGPNVLKLTIIVGRMNSLGVFVKL